MGKPTIFTEDTKRRQADRHIFHLAEQHLESAKMYFAHGEIDQDTLDEAQSNYDRARLKWWGWRGK